MPSSIDLWNSRFPDMFDITKSEPGYDYMDGIPAAQFPGIRQRNYGEDYQYGEPPQLQRRAEQLGTFKGPPPELPPEIRFKPKTKPKSGLSTQVVPKDIGPGTAGNEATRGIDISPAAARAIRYPAEGPLEVNLAPPGATGVYPRAQPVPTSGILPRTPTEGSA